MAVLSIEEVYRRYVEPMTPTQRLRLVTLVTQRLAETDALAAEEKPKPRRRFGSGKGLFQMAPDFDAPLEDFKEYMG